jgi:hypothetical protein
MNTLKSYLEMSKIGSSPAFPQLNITEEGVVKKVGISHRLYVACYVIQGLLANPNTSRQIIENFGMVNTNTAYTIIANTAYKLTDEILKQENE